MIDLHIAAEKEIGSRISQDEYQMALPAAQRKMAHIDNLSGIHHDEPYLAILIAEAVKAQRFTRYLDAVNDLRKQVRESDLEQRLAHL